MTRWISPTDLGLLVLRFFVGLRLIYGVIDNVLSPARMHEFAEFLSSNGFPVPFLSAVVSVYAQLVCGLLLLVGYYTRLAGILMVINFVVAIVGVHAADTIEGMTPPLSMLIISLALALTGAGKYSLDQKLREENLIQDHKTQHR